MRYQKRHGIFAQAQSLLQEYYHVPDGQSVWKSLLQDVFVTFSMQSGSGLFSSVLRGIVGRLFISSSPPMLIGSNVKIIHPHNMRFGRHVWIKDDVSLIAHGEMNIGNSVVIGERTTVWSEQQGVSIGDNTGVGKGCYLAQLGGKLEIGRECLLADHIHVYTASHRYMNAKKPILDQGYESYSIVIEDDVWIGTGVTIVGNVHIGKGAVIGAHSFVHQNIPKNAIVAGIPARVMKYRT